jgi:hypothetical protein
MHRRSPRLAIAAVLLVVPVRARAQRASGDSLPFTPGQWGLEAAVGGGAGAGALRFLSRATALTLNVGYTHSTATFLGVTTDNTVPSNTSDNVTATLGVRHYAPLAPSLGAFAGLGATVAYGRQRTQPNGGTTNNTGVGGIGEAGVSYFVARRLAVSASYAVSGSYISTTASVDDGGLGGIVPSNAHSHSWLLQATGARATVAIFF